MQSLCKHFSHLFNLGENTMMVIPVFSDAPPAVTDLFSKFSYSKGNNNKKTILGHWKM